MVREWAGKLHQTHRMFGDAKMEEITIAAPYKRYSVRSIDLISGHLLSVAKFISWQYVLIYGDAIVGMVELHENRETGKGLQFGGLYDPGSTIEKALTRLKEFEGLPQIKRHDHELRILSIKSIYFHAIWFHGGADDIIIPTPPTYGRMNAYQTYTEGQMIKLLKGSAEFVREFCRRKGQDGMIPDEKSQIG